jgi:hypothetical protein
MNTIEASARYLHLGVIQISWANVAVIVGMIIVFILAILLPFPASKDRDDDV